MSWLQFFDQGDRAAARAWLMRSTRAAQESGDPELLALAMIRGAEQQTYSGQAYQSTQLLDTAERLATSGSSPKALSWVLAANAEAHATLGELDPSLALLDRSLEALEGARLHRRLPHAHAASRAARAALDDTLHLGEELTVKHQSIYLVDLATTCTQEREAEEACHLAGKALDGANDCPAAGPGRLGQRSLRAATQRQHGPLHQVGDGNLHLHRPCRVRQRCGPARQGRGMPDRAEPEPQQGWAWIADGRATAGNLVELLGARIAHVLQTSADLDHGTRAALAIQLAESIAEVVPDFDRGRFIKAAQPDAGD